MAALTKNRNLLVFVVVFDNLKKKYCYNCIIYIFQQCCREMCITFITRRESHVDRGSVFYERRVSKNGCISYCEITSLIIISTKLWYLVWRKKSYVTCKIIINKMKTAFVIQIVEIVQYGTMSVNTYFFSYWPTLIQPILVFRILSRFYICIEQR